VKQKGYFFIFFMIKKKISCSKKTQTATATILSHTTPPSKTLLDNPMWSPRETVSFLSFLFLPCLPHHQNTNPRKKIDA
jgi:hypothetical protein